MCASQVTNLGLKFLSFVKIPTYYLVLRYQHDFWGVFATTNSYFGLFATHSLTNFIFRAAKKFFMLVMCIPQKKKSVA
jgi:hypothetical protein